MAVRKGTKARINWAVLGIRILAFNIAAITFMVSYEHTYRVVMLAKQGMLVAAACAALPDLLMGMSLIRISMKRPANHKVSTWVTCSFWFGLVLSLAANVYSAAQDGVLAMVVSVFPPVFVMLAVEMIKHADKTVTRATKRKAPVKAPVVAAKTSRVRAGQLATA